MDVNKRVTIIFILGIFILVLSSSFADDVRDPFSPLIDKNGRILIDEKLNVGSLKLSGIIFSKDEKVAIVNGEIVKEGDYIGNYIIDKIEENKVVLKKGDEKFILELEVE